MTFLVADRVQETTNSPGTGTATLLGAVSGYQSFSTGIGANNTTFYVIADQLGTNWEVGLGALNATGTVLTRTTVYSSSNGGGTVNFATGTQYVWCDFPASKSVLQGSAVNFSSIGATTAGTGAFTTLSASSTVSGAGFSNYFAAPPTIGNTTPNAGTFTTLTGTSVTDSGLTSGRVTYAGTGGLLQDSANMTFNGTTLTLANDASINGLTVGKGGGAVANNTAVGVQALNSNTTGDGIVAIGSKALFSNTTGITNVAVGGFENTYSIPAALQSNTTGNSNTGIGQAALGANTTGNNNTALGYLSLQANTTASNNTAVGYQAGYSKTTGDSNAFFGRQAGYAVTTGIRNTAIGANAMDTGTGGNYNTAVGWNSLSLNTADNNTAVGYQALYNETTGGTCTNIGNQAGYNITSGSGNTSLGVSAGNTITVGNYNVHLGVNANGSAAAVNYEIVVGSSTGGAAFSGKGSNTGFIYPNGGGVYQGNNSAAWSITSDQRLKKNIVDNTIGLSAITAIQVRNFEYRTANEVTELPSQNAIDIKGVQLGAIAQELQAILPDCVKTESTGVMSVDTTNLTWYLINAVKELNAKITALENK